MSLKFVRNGPINHIPALVQIMAWCRPGHKALSETMVVRLQTHIYASLRFNELIRSYPIVWTLFAKHDSDSAVFYAKFNNDWTIGMDAVVERDFARFEFNMCFGRIFSIALGLRKSFSHLAEYTWRANIANKLLRYFLQFAARLLLV